MPVDACCAPLASQPLNTAEAEELAPLFKALAESGPAAAAVVDRLP
jgi:hypothetical protein